MQPSQELECEGQERLQFDAENVKLLRTKINTANLYFPKISKGKLCTVKIGYSHYYHPGITCSSTVVPTSLQCSGCTLNVSLATPTFFVHNV